MKKSLFLLLVCLYWSGFSQNTMVITAPETIPESEKTKVFLAGSIDMGTTENWQAETVHQLSDKNVIILNPRRPDWNPDWKPVSSEPNFRKQVEWELEALDAADIIIMYLVPGSKSPISLLELGLYATSGKLRIVAPEGFWRKGNVDIVAEKYKIPQYESIEQLLEELEKELH